jgi:nucleoside diphosphate kinase
VACIVFVGTEAVRAGQSLLGDADPLKAAPGSLRAELCLDARYARMSTHTRKRARMRNEVRTFCRYSPSSVAP